MAASGGDGFPGWLTQLIEVLLAFAALLGFVLNRHDKAVDTSGKEHQAAMAAIEKQRIDFDAHKAAVASALQAEADRIEQRHEYLRRELAAQVTKIGDRVDEVGDRLSDKIDRLMDQRTDGERPPRSRGKVSRET